MRIILQITARICFRYMILCIWRNLWLIQRRRFILRYRSDGSSVSYFSDGANKIEWNLFVVHNYSQLSTTKSCFYHISFIRKAAATAITNATFSLKIVAPLENTQISILLRSIKLFVPNLSLLKYLLF